VDADGISVGTVATDVSPQIALGSGSYVLSAKLVLVTQPMDDASLVTCTVTSAASGAVDSSSATLLKNVRALPVALAGTLEVPIQGDSVRVVCTRLQGMDPPTAKSVKLIALLVGELG
jgi:hypothetical protein